MSEWLNPNMQLWNEKQIDRFYHDLRKKDIENVTQLNILKYMLVKHVSIN